MAHRIFVIGAGFSKAAGLPLGNELFPDVLTRIRAIFGNENPVDREVREYVKYKSRADGFTLDPEAVDFEDLMGHLDVEHALRLRGSDTDTEEGNGAQLLIRQFIGKALSERTPTDMTQVPEAYHTFVEDLDASDIVVSWNYDLLLERLLLHHEKPFRRFPERFRRVGPTQNEIDNSRPEIRLLKLHGSLDWIHRAEYDLRVQISHETGLGYEPKHPCFGTHAKYRVTPLVDGPRPQDDALGKLFCLENPVKFYAEDIPPTAPYILSPSTFKILYASPLLELWHGIGRAGALAMGLSIVGFSLPQHDEYIRRLLYEVSNNYCSLPTGYGLAGHKKAPVRIVDFRTDQAGRDQLKERYAFLDWERTELSLNGFNDEAVGMLLRR